jgi:thiaminase (transcriptional activator TenA)
MDAQDAARLRASDLPSTSAWLRQEADPIWEATFAHPVVVGIGSGETPLENFIYFLRQDYQYLIAFSRVFAYAGAKAADLETIASFAKLMQGTLEVEMALHRNFSAKFDLTARDLEVTEPSPTTLSYSSFLLSIAQSGTVADILASILPCFWGYLQIGERLAEASTPEVQPLYAEWIETYTAQEYVELCAWLRSLFDRLTVGARPDDLERYRRIFLTGSRYEYLFWEAARSMETWPV